MKHKVDSFYDKNVILSRRSIFHDDNTIPLKEMVWRLINNSKIDEALSHEILDSIVNGRFYIQMHDHTIYTLHEKNIEDIYGK